MRDLEVPRTALMYAREKHRDQQRSDGSPFIQHPLEVASLLQSVGSSEHLVAAGALHDLVEKTDVTAAELEGRFGARITRLVLAVSDDDRIQGYGERKAALRRQVAGAGDEALALFAADKLSKVRELRSETRVAPGSNRASGRGRQPRARRLRHYQRSLALLEERLPNSSLVRQLRDELGAFLSERPLPAEAR
jgi:(p)ppGpp synthase/HD superfamily hydrolase